MRSEERGLFSQVRYRAKTRQFQATDELRDSSEIHAFVHGNAVASENAIISNFCVLNIYLTASLLSYCLISTGNIKENDEVVENICILFSELVDYGKLIYVCAVFLFSM